MDKRDILARNYILSLKPVLYVPFWKRDGAEFISDDAYGHKCTAIGAVWTPLGRRFAATNKIIFPNVTILKPQAFTCIMWFNLDSLGSRETFGWGNGTYPVLGGEWGSDTRLFLAMSATNTRLFDTLNSGFPTKVNRFSMITFSLLGNAQTDINSSRAYVNQAIELPVLSTNAAGAQAAKSIPQVGDSAGGWDMIGLEGEVILIPRVISATVIRRIYALTKWRYI